jgi:membrane associated rhomboid family serine protease
MTEDDFEPGAGWPARTLPLRGRAGVVTLDERGIHHPRAPRSHSFAFTPYAEITHLAASPRAIWIGAKRSVYVLPRRLFADEQASDILLQCVLSRIEESPQGTAQLERMAALDEVAQVERSCRATWGLTFACLVVFAFQLVVGDNVEDAGFFNAAVLRDGDWWRAITNHFLHAFPGVPIHLALNLLGLIAFGTLTERPLGTAGTLVVMGLSAIGATLGSHLADYPRVVGVSGIVFGLIGAVTWLELRRGDGLPAWWRVPRGALLFMLVASAALSLLPFIAGTAHLGGALGGALGAAWVGRGVTLGAAGPSPGWMRATATVVVGVGAAGLAVGLTPPVVDPRSYVTSRLEQLARLPDATVFDLNERAWYVAIDPEATREQLEAALQLAERAVAESERGEPNVLDTLAELQFLLGFEERALATIEEAIGIQPGERYFREQRRRFLGERSREDRPEPPGSPLLPEPTPEEPGLTA